MSFGSRIKDARLKAGFTQKQLADIIGVSKGAIGNYENETSHPRDSIIYSMMKALNIDANYLFQDNMHAATGDKELTLSEQSHLNKYRELNEEGQTKIDGFMDDLIDTGKYAIKRGNESAKIDEDWRDMPA